MKYGKLPKNLGRIDLEIDEMMFVQYMPIYLIEKGYSLPKRFKNLAYLITKCTVDFAKNNGDVFNHNIYLTVKKLYQPPNTSFNRFGLHSDGFMTDDINYIWYDCNPTIFSATNYNLSMDDKLSLIEMEEQYNPKNDTTYAPNHLLKLNQFNIHKVDEVDKLILRTFIKVSFSKDKYDLKGNTHNYGLEYNWEMKDREPNRNIPQSKTQ